MRIFFLIVWLLFTLAVVANAHGPRGPDVALAAIASAIFAAINLVPLWAMYAWHAYREWSLRSSYANECEYRQRPFHEPFAVVLDKAGSPLFTVIVRRLAACQAEVLARLAAALQAPIAYRCVTRPELRRLMKRGTPDNTSANPPRTDASLFSVVVLISLATFGWISYAVVVEGIVGTAHDAFTVPVITMLDGVMFTALWRWHRRRTNRRQP